MSQKEDYYAILEVDQRADSEAIKKAYRAKALQFHPDRNPGDAEAEERFKRAAEAYGVLSDPDKRRIYDQYGHEGLQNQGGFGGFEDIFRGFGGGFGDFFRDIFGDGGGGRQSNQPRRGRDLGYELDITFVESFTGVEKEIAVPKEEDCAACEGTGSTTRKKETCPQCRGKGQIFSGQGFIRMASTCPRCRGTGEAPADPCPECHGAGRVRKQSVIMVKIPAGLDTGHRLRLQGKGDRGLNGGPPGDLFVEIAVSRHEFFARERNHVYFEKKIDMVLAALGGELEVPTVTGETKIIDVPAGSQNGKLLRLEGLGFPNPANPKRARGDLIVSLAVATPRDLTEEQKELLRKFARLEETKKKESFLGTIKRKVEEKIKNAFD
ncbi:MAG: molecular chaperone DnaJ [Deltaproteobacteria bacterium]|jgi:molecular chaperone DnaJ|nr:molecular chaperone DnaJ [Deltaproteobacteria bacterium]